MHPMSFCALSVRGSIRRSSRSGYFAQSDRGEYLACILIDPLSISEECLWVKPSVMKLTVHHGKIVLFVSGHTDAVEAEALFRLGINDEAPSVYCSFSHCFTHNIDISSIQKDCRFDTAAAALLCPSGFRVARRSNIGYLYSIRRVVEQAACAGICLITGLPGYFSKWIPSEEYAVLTVCAFVLRYRGTEKIQRTVFLRSLFRTNTRPLSYFRSGYKATGNSSH